MSILMSRQKKEFRVFEKNMKWFQDNYEKLREQFSGEYVAVNNSQVVMHDKDARTLISRLRQQCEDVGVFVVEFVSKEKVELIL
jgi:hypothetical protein